jgi:hypothetical protein
MTSTSAKFHPDHVAPKIPVQNMVFIQVGTLNSTLSEDVLPYTLLEMLIPTHSCLLIGKYEVNRCAANSLNLWHRTNIIPVSISLYFYNFLVYFQSSHFRPVFNSNVRKRAHINTYAEFHVHTNLPSYHTPKSNGKYIVT